MKNTPMIYGYARASTDGQSIAAQVAALRKHGAGKVFREVAGGAKTDRVRLRRLLDELDPGDVLMVTRLDRLARSTRGLLNTLVAAIHWAPRVPNQRNGANGRPIRATGSGMPCSQGLQTPLARGGFTLDGLPMPH